MRRILVIALVVFWAVPAFADQAPNLLAKGQLRRADNVQNPARINDGVAPVEGETWNSDFAAIVASNGTAEWDLGAPTQVQAALVQGDNNDTYVVSGSDDGTNFTTLWRAGPIEGAGMRLRTTADIHASPRYIRLTAEGGDKLYSVGELVLLASAGDLNSYDIARKDKPRDPPPAVNTSWLVVGAVVALLVLFLRKRPAPAASSPEAGSADAAAPVAKPEGGDPKGKA